MSTKEERKEQYRSLDLNGIKDLIKNSFKSGGIRVNSVNGALRFSTPEGEINIPDNSIEYYYDIFKNNIQKAKSYDMYINDMDNIMADEDPGNLCKNLKEIIDYINASELHREKYSVISQWLRDGTVTKEDMAKLYNAYSTDNPSGLDSNLLGKFKSTVKRNLEYYNILFKMFDIFDRSMFEGENLEESQL